MSFTYEQVAEYCEEYAERNGEPTHPFDICDHFGITIEEYHEKVDGHYNKWLADYSMKVFLRTQQGQGNG